MSYDPLTSFEPICYLARSTFLIAVNASSPYRTLEDLLKVAREALGRLTMASAGPATPSHVAYEMLKRMANFNMTYVPYTGDAPAVSALLGEHVTAAWANYTAAAEQVRLGRLRALAVTSAMRLETMPDVPTVAESGYKDFESVVWLGLVAPAKTPPDVVAGLAKWFGTAVSAPEIKPKLAIQGLSPVGVCGSEFGAHIRRQYLEYGRVIREANIKAE